jgi:hypothetical protein
MRSFVRAVSVLVLGLASASVVRAEVTAYDCGLLEGLASATKVLAARDKFQGQIEVFQAIVETKLVETATLRDDLRAAAGRVSDRDVANVFRSTAKRIDAVLGTFKGDIDAWSRKVDELDRVFAAARDNLRAVVSVSCPR